MRYRWMGYRYSVVLTSTGPRPFGEDQRFERLGLVLAQPRWRPPADVYETASAITVMVDLAGVDPEEIEAILYEDALVIEGQRRLPPPEPGSVYYAAEIRQGPFRLELALPVSVDPQHVEARYDRGILQVTLMKARSEERHGR